MNNEMIKKAHEIAYRAHDGQVRKKSGLPYIVHPCRVASVIARMDDSILTCAAFLHDVLEDCEPRFVEQFKSEIFNLNEKVLALVDELTYTGTSTLEKHQYLKSFEKKSSGAFIIKLFDRLDNVEDFANFGDREYSVKYAEKAMPLIDIWHDNTMFALVKEEYGKNAQEIVFAGIMKLKSKIGI